QGPCASDCRPERALCDRLASRVLALRQPPAQLAERAQEFVLAHLRASADVPLTGLLHQLVARHVGQGSTSGFRRAGTGRALVRRVALARLRRTMGRILAIGALGGGAFFLARATTAFAATGLLVDRGPGTGFGLLLGDATLFVALLDVFGLALLLGGVLGFISTWHVGAPMADCCCSAGSALVL